jgi:hypothetical protein
MCRGREANEPHACRFTPLWYRDTATLRHRGNSENRIRAAQSHVAAVAGRENGRPSPPRRLGHTAIRVVWSIGCFPGEWRNGRRAGFRCQCPSGRGGSSPPSPTPSPTESVGERRGRDAGGAGRPDDRSRQVDDDEFTIGVGDVTSRRFSHACTPRSDPKPNANIDRRRRGRRSVNHHCGTGLYGFSQFSELSVCPMYCGQ